MLAVMATVVGNVFSVFGATDPAPQPAAGCLPTQHNMYANSAHASTNTHFTLAEIKHCASDAKVVAAGTQLTKPGRYAIETADGGYMLTGLRVKAAAKSGPVVDVSANPCWAGGSFREIYSWIYYIPDAWLSEDTGNCIQWGWRVYNIWNSINCSSAIASCERNAYTLNQWGHWIQNAVDVRYLYFWRWGEFDNYCRQNLNDQGGQWWWCG